jgi:hypothetical protein
VKSLPDLEETIMTLWTVRRSREAFLLEEMTTTVVTAMTVITIEDKMRMRNLMTGNIVVEESKIK